MKNTTFAFMLLISFAFPSCHKNESVNEPINDLLKAAFNYKPGTYWIYRDSLSGNVDSFFVTRNSDGISNPSGNNTVEVMNIYISEYNIAPIPVNTDTQSWVLYYERNCLDLIYNPYDPNYLGGFSFAPVINYPYEDILYGSPDLGSSFIDTAFTINLFQNYVLNGNSFSNVAEINHRYDSVLNDWFYISPDVGIFKMRFNQTWGDTLYKIWEIQRWHIVKQ